MLLSSSLCGCNDNTYYNYKEDLEEINLNKNKKMDSPFYIEIGSPSDYNIDFNKKYDINSEINNPVFFISELQKSYNTISFDICFYSSNLIKDLRISFSFYDADSNLISTCEESYDFYLTSLPLHVIYEISDVSYIEISSMSWDTCNLEYSLLDYSDKKYNNGVQFSRRGMLHYKFYNHSKYGYFTLLINKDFKVYDKVYVKPFRFFSRSIFLDYPIRYVIFVELGDSKH